MKDRPGHGDRPELADAAHAARASELAAHRRGPEPAVGIDVAERRMLERRLIEDSNPKFRLTDRNAEAALDGPPGTRPEVRGPGVEGADVVFKDGAGNVVLEREVKCIAGNRNTFNDAIRGASQQVHSSGEVLVQVRPGTDVDGWVRHFQRVRSDANLEKYLGVRVTFREPDGRQTGHYVLGDRLGPKSGDDG